MAISIRDTHFQNNTTATSNFTTTTGAVDVGGTDSALLVFVGSGDATQQAPNAVTWVNSVSNQSLVQISSQNFIAGTQFFNISCWALTESVNADSGGEINVTWGNARDDLGVAVYSLEGVAQNATPSNVITNAQFDDETGTTDTSNTHTGGASGDWIIGVQSQGDFNTGNTVNPATNVVNMVKDGTAAGGSNFEHRVTGGHLEWDNGSTLGWDNAGGGNDFHGFLSVLVEAAASSVSGSLNETLDNFTMSASGNVKAEGSINVTMEDFTSVITGSHVNNIGSMNVTMEDFTSVITGEVRVRGSVGVTLEDFTSSASGTFTSTNVTGSMNVTLEDFFTNDSVQNSRSMIRGIIQEMIRNMINNNIR